MSSNAFEASWGQFGAPWILLGGILERLVVSWGVLGASRTALEASNRTKQHGYLFLLPEFESPKKMVVFCMEVLLLRKIFQEKMDFMENLQGFFRCLHLSPRAQGPGTLGPHRDP